MKSYIESYSSILPESQREKLNALVNVSNGGIANSDEASLEQQINSLMSQLGKTDLTMQLRLQPEEQQTDADSYNQTLREIIADLNTLYFDSNTLDQLIFNHRQLNDAVLASLEKDIKRLENKIETMNLLADNTAGYGTASRESFADNKMAETDREKFGYLFSDFFGKPIADQFNAEIDEIEGTLKLGSSASFDRIHTDSGANLATIEIVDQAGAGFSNTDPSHNINQAIDGKMDSFWGEVILSDGVLKVPLSGDMQQISGGALCTVKINFPLPSTVSQFSIVPYCEFPMEIVAIKYGNKEVEGWIKSPSQTMQDPIVIDSGITIDFPAVSANYLLVTIRQSHARKNYYLVSEDQVNNSQMWSKIGAAEYAATVSSMWQGDNDPSTVNPTLDQDKIDEFDVRWKEYLTAKKSYDQKQNSGYLIGLITAGISYSMNKNTAQAVAMGKAAGLTVSGKNGPDAPKRIQVEKYEYVYGAYEIGAKGHDYNPTGIYVSKPHDINGNVRKVVLEASEWHPKFLDINGDVLQKKAFNSSNQLTTIEDLRKTAIEYYVSCGDSPGDTWFPILPINQVYVNTEFLNFKDRSLPAAELRFYADINQDIRVYRGGEPLHQNTDWTIEEIDTKFPKDNFKIIRIQPKAWDTNSIYTADYWVDDQVASAHEIDFLSNDGLAQGTSIKKTVEYFNTTGGKIIDKNCTAKLSYYPYIDRGLLKGDGDMTYNPVQVSLNPSDSGIFNPDLYRIKGNGKTIFSEISSTRNPAIPTSNVPLSRLLNVSDYSSSEVPVLEFYDTTKTLPTFQYCTSGENVYFTETFRNDGPEGNYGKSNGNAIVKVSYDYLVSGVRCKIILRRTNSSDASVTPKIDWYSLKFKTLL